MRVCKLCGEPRGRIFNRHGGCRKRHESALEELLERCTTCALGRTPIEGVYEALSLASRNFVTESEIRDALITGFEEAVDIALYDALVSDVEERHLNTFKKNFDLPEIELDRHGACRKMSLGIRVRGISEGQMPFNLWESRLGDLPFGLQESEKCVWIFSGVRLETKSTDDRGLLALTTKRLLYGGRIERHQIPYGRIFNLSRELNGFSVNQGAATKSYALENGWFAWRLLSDLVKRD